MYEKKIKKEVRMTILEKWISEMVVKNITSKVKMDELHQRYSQYSEKVFSQPFPRKRFAFLLKQYFLNDINAGSILIYNNKGVNIKGLKILDQ